MEFVKLSNDVLMPRFGLGTYQVRDRLVLERIIPCAIENGYRLIDTAAVYQNEKMIGEILMKTLDALSIDRKDIFITSKISPSDLGYESTKRAIEKSISNLSACCEGYLDMMLIHWPAVSKKSPKDPDQVKVRADTWRALTEALDAGKLRAIGVSNYLPRHLDEFLHSLEGNAIIPHVNQIELHPGCYYAAKETIDWCNAHGVHVQAYSSLSRGVMLSEPFLQHFAWMKKIQMTTRFTKLAANIDEHEVDLVLLQWAVQHGFSVLPKSNSPERVRRNAFILNTINLSLLDGNEMQQLDDIGEFVKSCDKQSLAALGFPTDYITAGKTCWDPEIVA